MNDEISYLDLHVVKKRKKEIISKVMGTLVWEAILLKAFASLVNYGILYKKERARYTGEQRGMHLKCPPLK